jgi:uridylate kinase
MTTPIHSRVLIKLSGEALAGESGFGVDSAAMQRFAKELAELHQLGVEIAIVVGGGNYLRGKNNTEALIDRVTADQMAMLFTLGNGLAFRSALQAEGLNVELLCAFAVPGMVEQYTRLKAKEALESGKVVIFSGGIGQPLFSTDTVACLRAIELDADVILKASTVDGVYSADPRKDNTAERYDHLNYRTALAKQLRVMDLSAIHLCQDHDMPVRVFDMNQPSVFKRILLGETVGTLISN